MWSKLLHACRSSIQLKLFLSLTTIVAFSLAAILVSQVFLIQEYFVRQAESNLRSSNYLLSRVLADPIFEKDLSLLQTRLEDVQSRLSLCNFQLKDNLGTVVYKVGEVQARSDSEFNPNSRDGCYNTVIPVVHGDQFLGTVRMGVRTDDIAKARQSLIEESAFFALFWFAIFMLPFFVQIRRLVRPLGNLSKAAQQFAGGNLDYPTPGLVRGDDEISQLTSSFQGMAQALVSNRDAQASILASLRNEKSTLDALLNTMPVGVIFADRSHIRYCNRAFNRVCKLDPNEQQVGMKNDLLMLRLSRAVADADSFLKMIAEILETRTLTEPKYIALKDGRIIRTISNTVIAPESQGYLGRFWLFEDATEEKQTLEKAEQRADHDALTMLFNRQRYEQDLPRLIAQAGRDGSGVALLIFDLDDFKPINDLYGHAAGDLVLKKIATTLTLQLRRNEVLYRIGGDEFALVLVNASDDEVEMLAERIVKTVDSLTFDFNGTSASVGCSLGIARYPHEANTLQTLLHLADHAMYWAKSKGKNQFVFSDGFQKATKEPVQFFPDTQFGDMHLGISIMDAQHMAIANFIQGIINSLTNGDKPSKMQKRVELLIELCQINFLTEEELMRSHNITGLNEHQDENQQQLTRLRAIFGNLKFNERDIEKLTHEINEWFLRHIRGQDAKLAEKLRNVGVS